MIQVNAKEFWAIRKEPGMSWQICTSWEETWKYFTQYTDEIRAGNHTIAVRYFHVPEIEYHEVRTTKKEDYEMHSGAENVTWEETENGNEET